MQNHAASRHSHPLPQRKKRLAHGSPSQTELFIAQQPVENAWPNCLTDSFLYILNFSFKRRPASAARLFCVCGYMFCNAFLFGRSQIFPLPAILLAWRYISVCLSHVITSLDMCGFNISCKKIRLCLYAKLIWHHSQK